jgi:hypothetical protein
MNASSTISIAMLVCIGLASCAKDSVKPSETATAAPKAEDPKLVGKIVSIPADKRFVLIQSYGKWTVEAGTILTTRGQDDRAANLLATGEVLGDFAAADLQSGLVEAGDAVYLRRAPKPVGQGAEVETPPADPNAPIDNL